MNPKFYTARDIIKNCDLQCLDVSRRSTGFAVDFIDNYSGLEFTLYLDDEFVGTLDSYIYPNINLSVSEYEKLCKSKPFVDKCVSLADDMIANQIYDSEITDSLNFDNSEFEQKYCTKDKTFRYQLLSRLQSDCEYNLGWGKGTNSFWSGSAEDQIRDMISLWNSFSDSEKPEWLTLDELNYLSEKLTGKSLSEFGVDFTDSGDNFDSPHSPYTLHDTVYVQGDSTPRTVLKVRHNGSKGYECRLSGLDGWYSVNQLSSSNSGISDSISNSDDGWDKLVFEVEHWLYEVPDGSIDFALGMGDFSEVADIISDKISNYHDVADFGYDDSTPEGSKDFYEAVKYIVINSYGH